MTMVMNLWKHRLQSPTNALSRFPHGCSDAIKITFNTCLAASP